MDPPIEDGVGHGGIADVVVPLLDGQLAADEGCTHADALAARALDGLTGLPLVRDPQRHPAVGCIGCGAAGVV